MNPSDGLWHTEMRQSQCTYIYVTCTTCILHRMHKPCLFHLISSKMPSFFFLKTMVLPSPLPLYSSVFLSLNIPFRDMTGCYGNCLRPLPADGGCGCCSNLSVRQCCQATGHMVFPSNTTTAGTCQSS